MNVLKPVISTSSTPLRKTQSITKVALDTGATGHVFPTLFDGGNHNPIHFISNVNTAAGTIMKSKASDTFCFARNKTRHKCKKFDEVNTPLALVGTLCRKKQIVGVFDNVKGRLYDKRTMTLVAKAPLDLTNNLYIADVKIGRAHV